MAALFSSYISTLSFIEILFANIRVNIFRGLQIQVTRFLYTVGSAFKVVEKTQVYYCCWPFESAILFWKTVEMQKGNYYQNCMAMCLLDFLNAISF